MQQDFRPPVRPIERPLAPKRPLGPDVRPPAQPPVAAPTSLPPIVEEPTTPTPKKPRKSIKKLILFIALGLVVVLVGLAAAGYAWYNSQLSAVDTDNTELISVTIAPASSPKAIAELLKEEGVIRSTEAFAIYTRISKTQNSLQAGKYRLSPSESTPKIVEHLTKGSVDTFNLTFLPGATLAENKEVLLKAGFTEQQIDTAFRAEYDSPLFEGKPAGQDIEGYIYGETYNFASSATVEDILARIFTEYERIVAENDLVAKFKAQGLSLYQGIILASIVQRESIGGDEADIAQVFYNRIANGTMLGSDVTYQYIADKQGIPRDINLDSPYNTRRYTGLPPGPIAAPGLNSLLGVANPSGNDYLFFLSGDDDVTYYATDLAGHEANIRNHCKEKCQII